MYPVGYRGDGGKKGGDHAPQEISKPVRFNGQEVGNAVLAIDQRSQLHVSFEGLSNFLPEELFARIETGASYIGFDDLRARGLDVSYDPLADVIEIAS